MAGFHGASDYTKIAFFLLIGTYVFFIISYGAPYWTTSWNGHAGLWSGCTEGLCYERYNLWVAQWIKASQTFMTMSFIMLSVGAFCLFLYIFHKNFEHDKRLVLVTTIFSFITSLFVFLAVVVWASHEYMGKGVALNWAFAIACACSLSSFAAGLFSFFEMRTPIEK